MSPRLRSDISGVPIAPARRVGRVLIVDRCPHCGRRHVHGDGGERDGHSGFRGHRYGHCRDPRAAGIGYVLLELAVPKAYPVATPFRRPAAPPG